MYLPDTRAAWTTALLVSKGLEEQDDQIGCGERRDMKLGLKNSKETLEQASFLRAVVQWSRTLMFIWALKADLDSGLWRSRRGEGSQ